MPVTHGPPNCEDLTPVVVLHLQQNLELDTNIVMPLFAVLPGPICAPLKTPDPLSAVLHEWHLVPHRMLRFLNPSSSLHPPVRSVARLAPRSLLLLHPHRPYR